MTLKPETVGDILAEKSELSKKEIRRRVKQKKNRYGDLVSTTSALLLVGRETRVDVTKELNLAKDIDLDIENLVEDMNDVEIKVMVNRVHDINTFENDSGGGKVRNVDIGDDTGSTQLTLWGGDVEIAEEWSPGDTLYIRGGYTKYNDYTDQIEINVGDDAEVEVVDT